VQEEGVRSSEAGAHARRLLLDYSVPLLALALAASLAAGLWYSYRLQQRLVASLAQQGTSQQAKILQELRTLYTSAVVERARAAGIEVTYDYQAKPTAIPLPATLTIELGERIGESGAGLGVRLYSDYPFPWRKHGGPRDEFERAALAALRRDPTRPFFRYEDVRGERVLRYAIADRMRPACIACHNSHPASPRRDWKVGDVRGVLAVTRPISAFAASAQSSQRAALGLAALAGVLGLGGLGLVFGKQRRDARDLLEAAARLSAMDEASPLGTFIADAEGRVSRVNQEWRRITGYGAGPANGAHWSSGIDPADRERVLGAWRELTLDGRPFAVECRFARSDGSALWASCKAAPMQSGRQRLGYVGTLEDIGERKRVERMKSEFVSTVSHELRTPLTSIMGSLSLLAGGARGPLASEALALVSIARNNSERLVRLINDILDLEKIEAGQMRLELAAHELAPLVEQAVAANRAYAEQHGVTFELAIHCPGAQARVDADRLMQVMTNLLGNAAKFSPRGAAVEVRLMRDEKRVRLLVSDRGPGIPASFREKVFAKFSQADSSDTRRKGGTGLGLSISKAIVEAMGGSIGFDTREGAGTTFFFDLPEWSAQAALAANDGVECVDAQPRPCVLVCEDDRDVAALLCLLLERAGYQAVAAYDAASARERLAGGGFAAMTLDLQLPDLDGRTFLRQLREDPATRELAVVVVSGHVRRAARSGDGEALGVVDWLDKPIDEARLLEAVRQGTGREAARPRILHVEDDADLRRVIASLCGETADVECAASVAEAAQRLARAHYDLVILDLALPDRSGWELLPLIERQTPRPLVLVFSAKELSRAESGRVAAALVKSHASNPELLRAVQELTDRARRGEAGEPARSVP